MISTQGNAGASAGVPLVSVQLADSTRAIVHTHHIFHTFLPPEADAATAIENARRRMAMASTAENSFFASLAPQTTAAAPRASQTAEESLLSDERMALPVVPAAAVQAFPAFSEPSPLVKQTASLSATPSTRGASPAPSHSPAFAEIRSLPIAAPEGGLSKVEAPPFWQRNSSTPGLAVRRASSLPSVKTADWKAAPRRSASLSTSQPLARAASAPLPLQTCTPREALAVRGASLWQGPSATHSPVAFSRSPARSPRETAPAGTPLARIAFQGISSVGEEECEGEGSIDDEVGQANSCEQLPAQSHCKAFAVEDEGQLAAAPRVPSFSSSSATMTQGYKATDTGHSPISCELPRVLSAPPVSRLSPTGTTEEAPFSALEIPVATAAASSSLRTSAAQWRPPPFSRSKASVPRFSETERTETRRRQSTPQRSLSWNGESESAAQPEAPPRRLHSFSAEGASVVPDFSPSVWRTPPAVQNNPLENDFSGETPREGRREDAPLPEPPTAFSTSSQRDLGTEGCVCGASRAIDALPIEGGRLPRAETSLHLPPASGASSESVAFSRRLSETPSTAGFGGSSPSPSADASFGGRLQREATSPFSFPTPPALSTRPSSNASNPQTFPLSLERRPPLEAGSAFSAASFSEQRPSPSVSSLRRSVSDPSFFQRLPSAPAIRRSASLGSPRAAPFESLRGTSRGEASLQGPVAESCAVASFPDSQRPPSPCLPCLARNASSSAPALFRPALSRFGSSPRVLSPVASFSQATLSPRAVSPFSAALASEAALAAETAAQEAKAARLAAAETAAAVRGQRLLLESERSREALGGEEGGGGGSGRVGRSVVSPRPSLGAARRLASAAAVGAKEAAAAAFRARQAADAAVEAEIKAQFEVGSSAPLSTTRSRLQGGETPSAVDASPFLLRRLSSAQAAVSPFPSERTPSPIAAASQARGFVSALEGRPLAAAPPSSPRRAFSPFSGTPSRETLLQTLSSDRGLGGLVQKEAPRAVVDQRGASLSNSPKQSFFHAQREAPLATRAASLREVSRQPASVSAPALVNSSPGLARFASEGAEILGTRRASASVSPTSVARPSVEGRAAAHSVERRRSAAFAVPSSASQGSLVSPSFSLRHSTSLPSSWSARESRVGGERREEARESWLREAVPERSGERRQTEKGATGWYPTVQRTPSPSVLKSHSARKEAEATSPVTFAVETPKTDGPFPFRSNRRGGALSPISTPAAAQASLQRGKSISSKASQTSHAEQQTPSLAGRDLGLKEALPNAAEKAAAAAERASRAARNVARVCALMKAWKKHTDLSLSLKQQQRPSWREGVKGEERVQNAPMSPPRASGVKETPSPLERLLSPSASSPRREPSPFLLDSSTGGADEAASETSFGKVKAGGERASPFWGERESGRPLYVRLDSGESASSLLSVPTPAYSPIDAISPFNRRIRLRQQRRRLQQKRWLEEQRLLHERLERKRLTHRPPEAPSSFPLKRSSTDGRDASQHAANLRSAASAFSLGEGGRRGEEEGEEGESQLGTPRFLGCGRATFGDFGRQTSLRSQESQILPQNPPPSGPGPSSPSPLCLSVSLAVLSTSCWVEP